MIAHLASINTRVSNYDDMRNAPLEITSKNNSRSFDNDAHHYRRTQPLSCIQDRRKHVRIDQNFIEDGSIKYWLFWFDWRISLF